MFNRNKIAILHKSAIDRLIYPLCLQLQNTPELNARIRDPVATISLPPFMSSTYGEDTNNREGFTAPIQLNNSTTLLSNQRFINNPIPFTTGVYNQEPITYKHLYTLFVPPITPSYTSSRYANRKYCLFYVNLTFASNDYAWDSDALFNMSIN